MNRGDVAWVELPAPRNSPGHEQTGTRPAVIIQDDRNILNLSTVVVVPITSNQGASRFDGGVPLSPSAENGLTLPSVAMTSQIRAVDRQRVKQIVGSVSPVDMQRIETALRSILGF